MVRAALPLLALALCLTTLPPAGADHPLKDVVFDHKGGNEWWVQLQLGGDDRDWSAPMVRDTGGEWRSMTRPSWAPNDRFYVLSYHVEPGHQVQFRVENPGDVVVSCWYEHPSGAERCDGTEKLTVTFRPMPEAGRIRVAVDANKPLEGVAFDVGGGFVGMALQADGTWTYDAYVPAGLPIEFIAFAQTDDPRHNDWAQSGCYAWPSLARPPCPWTVDYDGFADSPETFGGSPSNLLVHARGTLSDPLARVQVRYDGGEFMPLTYAHEEYFEIWYHHAAPSSGTHTAEFRVVSESGATACTDGAYLWPREENDRKMVGEWDAPVFMHVRGNANWVQTSVFAASQSFYAVEAQVDGGSWVSLQAQTWCGWAKAISAPAGSTVRFRAFDATLDAYVSPAFAWPPGGPTVPPPPPDPAFDATFTGVKGNAWWVQASVAATGGTLAKVDVSLDGGAWKPLANKGWGWAASYAIPAGTVVQLRATSTTGATDLSACYRWTAATPTACPGGGTDPGDPADPAFDATFRNVKGNAWWLQTDVSTTGGTLAGVDARVNGGTWIALTKQSWGSWAKSIHAPAGSTVEFRARSTDGGTDMSGAYTWPPG